MKKSLIFTSYDVLQILLFLEKGYFQVAAECNFTAMQGTWLAALG